MLEPAIGILRTLVTMLVVMGVGAFGRKRGLFGESTTFGMRALVADVCFPALCFQGLVAMDRHELSSGVIVIALGFVTLTIAAAVGVALARIGATAERAGSLSFAIAIGNWIFFPLPIAKLLFEAEGERVVLLFNAGAQLFLWTLGMAMLRPDPAPKKSRVPKVLANPGLWATLAGLVLAIVWPGAGRVPVVSDALTLVGSMTVPLAAIAIGAGLVTDDDGAPSTAPLRETLVGTLGRLVIAPLVTLLIFVVAFRGFHVNLPRPMTLTLLLIAAMPVSLTAGTLVPKRDSALVSRTIALSTVFSAVTVPAFYTLVSKVF